MTLAIRLHKCTQGIGALRRGSLRHSRPNPGSSDVKKQSPLRVLIVDDNIAAAQSLSWLVEDMGHETAAAKVSQAFFEIEKFAPDVVLIDLQSPGLKGLELCHAIRADPHHWHLWVVAISGRGDLSTVEDSGTSGFDVGIPKPVNANGLEKLLAQFELMLGRD